MTRGSLAGFAMLLCVFPATVGAQWAAPPTEKPAPTAQTVAPAPDTPPPPRPPGTYPPPPPRWADQPPMEYPFPTATGQAPTPTAPAPTPTGSAVEEPEGIYRRFSFTAAIGPGALIGPGENALAISYQVARAGVGIDRDLSVLLGYEGAGTSSVNPKNNQDSWLKQEIVWVGLQKHFERRFYVRGGLGFGFVSEKTDTESFSGGIGKPAALVGFGYELMQRRHFALALDMHASLTHYPKESWKTLGADVAVSFF